ncbi:MAG TPA: S9 family peptidase [Nevskiaceae bacterium]|nr:S9 family peptidase [Nevskiaceae bacterium]
MTVAPYGTWVSPLSAAQVAAGATRLDQVQLDGRDVYWIETRPQEQGRSVIVRRSADGRIDDVTPQGFNARSGVHQYGGGSYAVRDGTVYFCNFTGFSDNQLFRQSRDGAPVALTRTPQRQYADLEVDAKRERVICVREDHGRAGEASNEIVAIPLQGVGLKADPQVLASGADFYSNPRLSPDGTRLAWLQWNHPNMPWDGTELWIASLAADGSLTNERRVAGGARESIFQPQWSPSGELHFVSDRTGWWNLYRLRDGDVQALAPMDAEFGEAQWVFGESTYAFIDDSRIACSYSHDGRWHLAVLDASRGELNTLDVAYAPHLSVRADRDAIVFLGTAPTSPDAIVRVYPDGASLELVSRPSGRLLDAADVSIAESIRFPSRGRSVHAFYYAPKNHAHRAPEGEKPPLIVISHGGPTSAAVDSLNPKVQFWTTRGFAVVDVNYGGSTGFGRAYRDALNGQWGIVDVDDCIAAAQSLVAQGKADPRRLIIRGGSAGGYTTLAALAFHDVFKAGASHYGVSDVEALAVDTHKFESRYLDQLIGPYPATRDVYRARSPIHAAGRIRAPLILFQGLEDKVVPPSQSQKMADALRANGVPVAYLAFEGEQHGFRKAENIVRSLEAELAFYGAVLGFKPAGDLPALHIDNIESRS